MVQSVYDESDLRKVPKIYSKTTTTILEQNKT